jgi:hypothetical protein
MKTKTNHPIIMTRCHILYSFPKKTMSRKNWPAKSIENRLAGQLIKMVEAAGIEPASQFVTYGNLYKSPICHSRAGGSLVMSKASGFPLTRE